MSFVARILRSLEEGSGDLLLHEARDGGLASVRGSQLLDSVSRVRAFLRTQGLQAGDRCGLLGANSTAWVAADIALLAEGIVVVPLYARQRAAELAGILRDAQPKLLICEGTEQSDALREAGAPEIPVRTLADALATDPLEDPAADLSPEDPVTIIYTSGTSGEPKGVVLNGRNLEFMLDATMQRLDVLMDGHTGPERVFHYLPFCFAGSWILMLLCLLRRSELTLNTDLSTIVEDLALARPHYFQNVPVLLDRVRDGVEKAIRRRGGPVGRIWNAGMRAAKREADGETLSAKSRLALGLARRFVFPSVRRRIGADLRALICGSAPLSRDTQLFFHAIGIPVLQVYGLTETTAICTMDTPGAIVPGRVGTAIPDVEMKLGEDGELLVRGPNVFGGYWNRPEATSSAFVDGWFRTGDQGEADENGNWRILGRVKNLIVPSSGHNVAPEPLEEKLAALLPGSQQVVLIGNGRPHLAVVVTGDVDEGDVTDALESFNADAPHYKKVRGSIVVKEPFTIESGLITANGKLRRDAIAERLAERIDALYAAEQVSA